MKLPIAVVVVCAVCFSCMNCHAQTDKIVKTAAKSSHVMLPSPPLGFTLVRRPLVIKDKFIGFNILLQKEGSNARVMIRVDLREEADFSVLGWRSGATKGYINGFVSSVTNAGFAIEKKKFPEFENNDLTGEMKVEVEFKNKNGDQLYANQRIFFDSRGFSILTIADSSEGLKALSTWANMIQRIKN